MSGLLWSCATAAAMALAGASTTAVGIGQRRQMAARVAGVRPVPATATTRSKLIPGLRLPRLHLLDTLLGIERDTASDEPMPVVRWLVLGAVAGAVVFVIARFLLGLSPLLSVLAGLPAGLIAARSGVGGRRDGIRTRMADEFALALGVIIRCVRVGLPVSEAMRAVSTEVPAPTGPEFRRCVDQIQLGEDFDLALLGLARRCALPEYRFFAVSVSLQRQTGGNLAETLDNLTETMRKRKAMRLRIQSLTSEPKATVLVLALLPVVVGGILMLVRPDYVLTLFVTDSGRTMLGIAVVMQAFGMGLIRAIIGKALS